MENEREGMKRGAISWCTGKEPRKSDGPVIALASFPGSGNTWLRYLLQQVTGRYPYNAISMIYMHGIQYLANGITSEQLLGWSVQCTYIDYSCI